jgi:long-subunit acyl-CoA synthetase (AMP-forming)
VVGDAGWTPDSDVLTATGKMRRNGVAERYQDLIDEMYDEARR